MKLSLCIFNVTCNVTLGVSSGDILIFLRSKPRLVPYNAVDHFQCKELDIDRNVHLYVGRHYTNRQDQLTID